MRRAEDASSSGRAAAAAAIDARPPSTGSVGGPGIGREGGRRHHPSEQLGGVDASDDFLTALHGGSDFTPPQPLMSDEHSASKSDGSQTAPAGLGEQIDKEMGDALKEEKSSGGDVLALDSDPSQPEQQQMNSKKSAGPSSHSKRQREDDEVEEAGEVPDGAGASTSKRKDGYLDSEAYDPIKFGDFSTYMKHKRQKLKVQENALVDEDRMLRAYQASQMVSSPSAFPPGGRLGEGTSDAQAHPGVFKGCCIYINGLTTPPFAELRRLIVLHGGDFMAYLDAKTPITHIVASSLTPKKRIEFKDYKVVNERWVLDSVREGRRMDWRMYRVEADAMLALDKYQEMKVQREQAARVQGNQWANSLRRAGGPPSYNHEASAHQTPSTPQKGKQIAGTTQLPPTALADKDNTSPWGKGVAQRKLFDMLPQPGASKSNNSVNPKSPPAAGPTVRDDKEQYSVGTDPPSRQAERLVPWSERVDGDEEGLPFAQDSTKQAPFTGYASRPSNAHAARLLASPSWRESNTASSADFLSGYFAKSRLHHLSMWKMQMRDMVEEALREAGRELGSRDLPKGMKRVIMHVDFDSFFVSVGLRDRPELRERPVVVCHARGQMDASPAKGQSGDKDVIAQSSTSEIASCNYVARTYGVKNGMSLGQAKTKCADLIAIPYDFKAYDDIAIQFYTILIEHADAIEAVSVDEALIDVSFLMDEMAKGNRREGAIYQKYMQYLGSQGDSWTVEKQFAEALRDVIRERTRTEASIGIGSNVLLARLATRKAKPGGSYHLLNDNVSSFLSELDIDDLHGIGWAAREKCKREFNCFKISDLVEKSSESSFRAAFGPKEGATYWAKMHGKDREKLVGGAVRNSIGAAVNYAMRFKDQKEAETFVSNLCQEVADRMERSKYLGRKVWVHVMVRSKDAPVEAPKFLGHGVCDNYHKSLTLPKATRDVNVIRRNAWSLMESLNADPRELRGIGIGMETLSKTDEKGGLIAPRPQEGQTLLNFGGKASSRAPSGPRAVETSLQAEPESPLKEVSKPGKVVRFGISDAAPFPGREDASEIEDTTPLLQPGPTTASARQRSVSPALERRDAPSDPNMASTQYVIPTQLNESILGELPGTMQAQIRTAQERKLAARAMSEDVTVKAPDGDRRLTFEFTASQLDQDVMKELPPSLRKEILRDLAIKSHRTKLDVPVSRRRAVTESPRKGTGISPPKGPKKVRVARDQTLLDKTTLQAMDPSMLTNEELREAGVDPDYFRGLPIEFQRELIKELAAAKKSKRARSYQSKHLEEMTRAERRAAEAKQLAEDQTLIGQSVQPLLQAQKPREEDSPALKGARTVTEVRTFFTQWFSAHKDFGPRPGDVKRVQQFLEQSIRPEGGLMPDLEKVESLLQWWRHLIDRAWSAEEASTTAATSWWRAFRSTRDDLNAIITKDFGLPLRL